MKKLFRALTVGTILAFAATSIASAADAPDAIIGTWNLNLEKSKFAAGNAPKSMTRTYAAAAGGTAMTISGVRPDGSTINESATLTYDGKDIAWTGSRVFDTVTLKKANGTTVKAELKKDGKVVGHSTRTITGSGRILTISSALKTAKGGTIHETAVYDKQ